MFRKTSKCLSENIHWPKQKEFTAKITHFVLNFLSFYRIISITNSKQKELIYVKFLFGTNICVFMIKFHRDKSLYHIHNPQNSKIFKCVFIPSRTKKRKKLKELKKSKKKIAQMKNVCEKAQLIDV